MVYIPCVSSAVTTDFFRSLGATAFHFGLLSGLPMLLVALQFVGAHWTNHMRHRRPWFMILVIAGRLLYLPVALLPLLTTLPPATLLALQIGLIALGCALQTVTYPMWLSWMSDLIPRRIFNRYWGRRQRVTILTMTATTLAISAFTYLMHGLPVPVLFLILVIVGCTAGTIDILLFRHVREPPNTVTHDHPWKTLREPLHDINYRKLVRFLCLFYGVSMLAAPFMQIYTLDVLQVPLWITALMWCTPGLGAAAVAPLWGRVADRFGNRPILRLCVILKPGIPLVFLLVTPDMAVPVLSIALMADNMLNAGIEQATNGYVLKMAPRANRPMFIAATSAVTGLACGSGAILGGWFLKHTVGFAPHLAGRDWNHYQLIFLISFLLRILCIPLPGRIQEPSSAPSRTVLNHLLGLLPEPLLAIPAGLYRRFRSPEDD
ncbi:MAG: MFS transporter [Lentisphaerae bacterium]|nr:MFS transporter [Lentisphaerota bacterium]